MMFAAVWTDVDRRASVRRVNYAIAAVILRVLRSTESDWVRRAAFIIRQQARG